MSKKNNTDHFELLKEEFEYHFKVRWDERPELYLQYYQARVLDALLLSVNKGVKILEDAPKTKS